ncbi:MAG: DUF1292 domain-containing protein [Clostridia bacterium]|nr:DUF1292 domain-containing protein [Clostridia bacterium]
MKNERFVDKLFGEESENIFLEDNDGKEIEFEQVAVVDYEANYYAVLSPVTKLEGVEENEVMIFLIDEENDCLVYLDDEELCDKVFDAFIEMLDSEE